MSDNEEFQDEDTPKTVPCAPKKCQPKPRGCCSLRCCGVIALLLALIPTVVNPTMNAIVLPADEVRPFIEGQTEISNYEGLRFQQVKESELHLGLAYMFMQMLPKWLGHLWMYMTLSYTGPGIEEPTHHNVTFRDAREYDIDFHETGFTLFKMDKPSETQNWRDKSEVEKFQAEIEPKIRELYPDAKRLVWTYHVVRGGSAPGDQPAAIDGPHLDYTQNDTARELFHEEYPPLLSKHSPEHHLLLGKASHEGFDEEEGEMQILLGIWKPVMMETPVCDLPLAVADARTFQPEEEGLNKVHINFGVLLFHNLNGGILHSPDQTWYYYPYQTTEEVLIFTQYTRGRFFANPHTSFKNPNCPPDMDTRKSIEMRLGLFF